MSNEKFKVKFGLAVGDIAGGSGITTVDGTTGETIIANGTTGQVTIGGSTQGKLEIGKQNRATSGTPYLDFHSSATAADYDVRMIVSGGTSTSGNGTLNVYADTAQYSGDVTIDSNLAVNGDGTASVISSTALIGTLYNTGVADVRIGEAATSVSIGANTGTTTINNSLVADDISILTVDTTNLEVTNIKAKDGTAAATIANTTGIITVSTELNVDNINISGNTISSTNTNGDILITPNGTGDVDLVADTVQVGDANATATVTTNGTGDLVLNTNNGTNAGNITLTQGVNGNITLTPNGTGVVTVASDLAVNGGDITTTQTTASLFNATATTLNLGGAATTTNIGPATTGSSIVSGANRLTSPVIFNFAGANNYRGLLLSNLTSGSYAAARNGLVMRTVPTTAIGPRGGIVFENARSSATGVLAALQGPSTTQAGDFLGEITSGGYATDRYVTEAVATTSMAFTPYATETWVNSGTTISNAGTGWALQLQPTATNLTATSKITTVDTTPQNLSLRSDAVGISKGKTVQFIATGCSTSGTTLTIGTLTSGTVAVGTMIQNSTNLLPAGTYIVANISGSGSGSTWQLNQTQTTYTGVLTLAGYQGFTAMTGAGNVDIMGNLTVRGTPGTTLPINYSRVYGQWQNTNTVTPAASNTAYAFALPTTDFNNIATVGSTSRIIPGASGMYKLQFSVQVRNDDSAAEHIAYFWWRKNGTDVPNSMGQVGVPKATGAGDALTIAGWDNMISSANTTDYWELMYAVDDANHVDFPFAAAQTFGPATASLFVTLVPIGA